MYHMDSSLFPRGNAVHLTVEMLAGYKPTLDLRVGGERALCVFDQSADDARRMALELLESADKIDGGDSHAKAKQAIDGYKQTIPAELNECQPID